jgi:hypothetical protein
MPAIANTTSLILRVLSIYSLKQPDLIPWSIAAIVLPILYVVHLLGWTSVDQSHHHLQTSPHAISKRERKKMRRLNGSAPVKSEATLPRQNIWTLLTGSMSSSRGRNVVSLLVNTLLMLAVVDHRWTPLLAYDSLDIVYARYDLSSELM